MSDIIIRPATLADIPDLEALIVSSVQGLQAKDYTQQQRDGALGKVFGVDRQLIVDQTYLIAEKDGAIVGCGGWSRRRTLFGSDAITAKDDAVLRPGVDAARIRAFFIEPDHARQGIGSKIMQACEAAAFAYGFTELELVATLTGENLYRRHGFIEVERYATPLDNGLDLAVVRMKKILNHYKS
jgi:N-acetylglutamate synthase-like GNAT family acetyltransferase